MEFTDFGIKLSSHSGILQLMDDIGRPLPEGIKARPLGGGNPARVPEVEKAYRHELEKLLADGDRFEDVIAHYDSPQGRVGFLKTAAEFFSSRYGWDITEENIALTFSTASNVGVIVSVSPFFTALFTRFFGDKEPLRGRFFVGFAAAMAGIGLISFWGSPVQVNPVGDLLSLGAAVMWGCYSVLTRKISGFGYTTIQTTRRVFAYGIAFMLPTLLFLDFRVDVARFSEPENVLNILFLGVGASAICFVTWNFAVKVLGAVKTSVYIYLIPVVTVITSVLVLHEKISGPGWAGILLTLAGLALSEYRGKS